MEPNMYITSIQEGFMVTPSNTSKVCVWQPQWVETKPLAQFLNNRQRN